MKTINIIITKLFIDNPYLKYFVSCHQLSNRSFFLHGRQFHICARCTGIFIGLLLSPILVIINYKIAVYLFPLGAIFILTDWLTQSMKLRESNNILRLVSGLFFGFTFLSFAIFIVNFLFQELR